MKYFQLRNQLIPIPMNGLVSFGVVKESSGMVAKEGVKYEN